MPNFDEWETKYLTKKLAQYGTVKRLAIAFRYDRGNMIRLLRRRGIKTPSRREAIRIGREMWKKSLALSVEV